MRDDTWLETRLGQIWKLLFPDIERKNNVVVRFKGRWENKFGHIKSLKDGSSEIAINGLFRHYDVPEYMIDVTIAHELCHYMHGFSSPHEKKYKHPHKGGIVSRELRARGFGHLLRLERDFARKVWPEIYAGLALKKRFLNSSQGSQGYEDKSAENG